MPQSGPYAAQIQAALASTPGYTGLFASALGVNVNSANSDVATLTIPYAKYIVRRIVVTNASVSLVGSSASLAFFTAAAGGGTAVSSNATMTALTATTKFIDRTLAAGVTADVLTAPVIYIRCGGAHGSAATVDVYFYGEILP